jgi:hypothetical protein
LFQIIRKAIHVAPSLRSPLPLMNAGQGECGLTLERIGCANCPLRDNRVKNKSQNRYSRDLNLVILFLSTDHGGATSMA